MMYSNRPMGLSKGIAMAAVSAMLLFSGCGGGTGRSGESEDTARLEYTPQVNEVDTVILSRRTFRRQLTANGKLSAVRKSALGFRSSGIIASVNAENGDAVRKGDVIASLDMTEKRLALRSARLSLEKAEMELYDVLAGLGYIVEDTLSVPEDVLAVAKMRSGYKEAVYSLEGAEYDYTGASITAPFSGKVAGVELKPYDASGSSPFCTLIDDSEFDVTFTVLEAEYGFLARGLKVKVEPFSSSGDVLYGEIVSVNPSVDENGLVSVKARVPNNGSLVDGMNVSVSVEKDVDARLVVPKSAVVIRDNEYVLFRYVDGRARWTYVHIVMDNSESYAVEANVERGAELEEGDAVIISGNLNLADDSEVRIKD